MQSSGTDGVPVAVEITFREGGRLDGCAPIDGTPGCYVLDRAAGSYSLGDHRIRFGPGAAPHRYVQVRGAEPRLSGVTVYITGYTPFDHTLFFEA